MAHINTITIAPQESADDLAAAFAAALGTALGWTVDGTSVWQDKTKDGLRFYFGASSNNSVDFYTANSSKTDKTGNYAKWSADTYYYLDYYNTGHTVAAGIRTASGMIVLGGLIAKNTLGAWRAFCAYATTAVYLDSVLSASYTWTLACNASSNACTSIVKCPDIWGGCMFEDLYLMISCPQNSTDKVFYLNGQYYRYVGVRGTEGFAIPVG